jgi:hypothetical protein
MKYIPIILLIIFMIILAGCGPVGDFLDWYNLPS